MVGPAYIADPTVHYLSQLLDELAKGSLQLLHLQRLPSWSDEQRLQLLQNICDGIPIGSALVWRTSRVEMKALQAIGPHDLPEPSARSFRSFLLDGSPRFPTLFGCLRPQPPGFSPFTVNEYGEEVSWRVGFHLGDEELQVLERDQPADPLWLPLPTLLDSLRLLQFQRGLPAGPERERLLQRSDALAETFRTYKLPVVPLVSESLAVATRAFARVNYQGPLRAEMALARAMTWSEGFDLEEQLGLVQEQLAEVAWESLEPEWIFASCKAALGLELSVESPDQVSKLLLACPEALAEAGKNLALAASWLAAHCGVPSAQMVPSRLQAVMLAEAMRLCPQPDAALSAKLGRWFWSTTYSEALAETADSKADSMLDELRQIACGQTAERDEASIALELEIPSSFNPASARVKAMALRLAALGPLELDGSQIPAVQQLAAHGVSSLVPISPGLRGCAGRIFIQPGSKLRDQLLGEATAIPLDVLASHAITDEAARALTQQSFARFLELRGAEIRRLEEEHYASTQAGA